MTPTARVSSLPLWRQPWVINSAVTVASVVVSLLLLPSRVQGMELLGVSPHWLLIWVVAWSIKRTQWEGAIAGLVLGTLQDAMTSPHPTHSLTRLHPQPPT